MITQQEHQTVVGTQLHTVPVCVLVHSYLPTALAIVGIAVRIFTSLLASGPAVCIP